MAASSQRATSSTELRGALAWEDAPVLLQVFVAGAGTMALEMLAGRLLAPRFGSTIFVWGSIIGVVLTGLALGYYAGGRLGDSRPVPSSLAFLLLGGGAFALLMPLFGPPILAGVASMLPGPRAGPLVAATLLLGPPSLILGGATPVAVRLTAGPTERAGTTAGTLFGLSTAGSIAGTFLTVFVLIPALDVTAILTGVGALLALASLVSGADRLPRAGLVVILLIASPMGQAAFSQTLTGMQTGITDEILHQRSSSYHEIYVTQDRNPFGDSHVRTLIMDGLRHSAMYTDRPAETPFGYVEHFHLGPLIEPDATSVLFVGAGGMSGPKQFLATYPGMQVDAVEVDPAVVDIAETYFAVPTDDPRLNVTVADGRHLLEQTDRTWDIIVLDAYGRDYIPFHLLTQEFLATAEERLSPHGVVVSNVIGTWEGEASKLARAEARTMHTVFDWTRHVPTQGRLTGAYAQNIMLVAGSGEPPDAEALAQRAQAWEADRGRAYTMLADQLDAHRLHLEDVPILTDGYAPVADFLNPVTMRPYDPSG